MTLGRVMAFDPGTKRIGIAVSDPLRIVAAPLTVIDAADPWADIEALLDEYAPTELVVGLPVSLSGREGPSAERVRAFRRSPPPDAGYLPRPSGRRSPALARRCERPT